MRNWKEDWEMCERATRGKWRWHNVCVNGKLGTISELKGLSYDRGLLYGYKDLLAADTVFDAKTGEHVPYIDVLEEDAEFIAKAREALPYWMQQTKKLEETIKEIQNTIDWVDEQINLPNPNYIVIYGLALGKIDLTLQVLSGKLDGGHDNG